MTPTGARGISKAFAWSRLRKVRPKDFFAPMWKSRSTIRFWVDDNGNLGVENWTVTEKTAVQVARWILDTFGEDAR